MYRLTVKSAARELFYEAYQWYEEQLPGLGERFLTELDEHFRKLQLAPYSYSLLQDSYRHQMMRHFPYKIVFEIKEDEIIVYSIFHTNKNPGKIFE